MTIYNVDSVCAEKRAQDLFGLLNKVIAARCSSLPCPLSLAISAFRWHVAVALAFIIHLFVSTAAECGLELRVRLIGALRRFVL